MDKIELLSPAGDLEKLKIAYLYGADACYIGGKDFSLRANANNFSLEEIKEGADFAHSLNKKIYVTVNIVFHEGDINGVEDYLKELDKINVDGIILSDPLLIPIIKKTNLKIIISTQNSTCNVESVKYWMSKGADKIVLAREVPLKEIKKIIKETGANTEIFLHGAMCTCISGRCVLSNYFTGRDSNRGGCAQVCRFNFDLDKKRKKDFSIATKDLMLAKYIPDFIDIGVKSLKIEGRMRSIYYLATVNKSYRKLIDAYYSNNFTKELLKHEEKILKRVANRESTSQYIKGKVTTNDQYYTGREENSNQDFLAFVTDYKDGYAYVEQRNYFKVGDKVTAFGPNLDETDFVIEEIINEDGEKIQCANHPKEALKIKIPIKIDKNSMIRVSF